MGLSVSTLLYLSVLIFVVAVLYSSVGHGGASGYLAVLALFSVPPEQMASTALILNVLVAGLASISFVRAGHFSLKRFWPFAVTSIPFAFIGGMLGITDNLYHILLALALVMAAFRLSLPNSAAAEAAQIRPLRLAGALPAGAGVGMLSGMVGIGGGIFLSPLMMLLKWATAKETAAVAAVFILVNSVAGLAGRAAGGELNIVPAFAPLTAAAAGGLLGSYWGARRFSGLTLRRVLALVLFVAAVKLAITVH